MVPPKSGKCVTNAWLLIKDYHLRVTTRASNWFLWIYIKFNSPLVVLLKSILCATEEHFLCKIIQIAVKTQSLKNNKQIQVCISFHQILKQFEGSKKHNIMAALHAKSRLGYPDLPSTYDIFVSTSFAYNVMSKRIIFAISPTKGSSH